MLSGSRGYTWDLKLIGTRFRNSNAGRTSSNFAPSHRLATEKESFIRCVLHIAAFRTKLAEYGRSLRCTIAETAITFKLANIEPSLRERGCENTETEQVRTKIYGCTAYFSCAYPVELVKVK